MLAVNDIDQFKQLTTVLAGSPFQDHQKILAVFEAIREIIEILNNQNSQQKQLLKELKISEARYRTVFEHSPNAIFLMKHDLYIDCNKKASEMFRCEKEDLLNINPAKFSPEYQPDGSSSADGVKYRTSKTIDGFPQSFMWEHLRKDGTPFCCQVRLDKIDLNGGSWFIAHLHERQERKGEYKGDCLDNEQTNQSGQSS